MKLSSEVELMMQKFAQYNPPVGSQVTPDNLRAYSLRLQELRGPIENVYKIINHVIPTKTHEIPVRIYQPNESHDLPLMMYFHGGGHVLGNLDSYDNLCRSLANRTQCLIVSVDYRRAPEYKYPADQDDAYFATVWTIKNASEFNGDPSIIFVAGDSAGGNLAAQVCIRARDNHELKISGQILIYPELDLTYSQPSIELYKTGYLLTKDAMCWFHQQYLPKNIDRSVPNVSPFFADKKNLPPAIILTAQFDPLRDEGEEYAKQLKQAGVQVVHKRYEGMIHGFILYPEHVNAANEARNDIGREVQNLLIEQQATAKHHMK